MDGDQAGPGEPDETLPVTHRAWGEREPENPYTSPSGPAAQPSGAGYVGPSWAEPSPGQAPPGVPPYGNPGYVPTVYGQPLYPQLRTMHPSATTAMTLGLVSLIGGFMCGLPLVLGPFAWWTGARARRDIRADPRLDGDGQALAGMVTGIIATVFLAIGVLALVLLAGLVAVGSTTSSTG
ncbi:MAG: hypothetical protein JWO11_3269 [Nocardioides sp.]|nr:hypothetical protein [Nocardioides sp.]